MAEAVQASFMGAEIWGLQRRTPCIIVLTDRRLIVVKGTSRKALPRVALGAPADDLLHHSHYSLTYETVRYIEQRRQVGWTLFKLYTTGGGYRFRLTKRTAAALEEGLRAVLGPRLKSPA